MNWRIKKEEAFDPELIRALAIMHLKVLAEWNPEWKPETDLTEPLINGEISKLSPYWGKPSQLILTVRSSSDEIIGYHWASCAPLDQRISGMPWYGARIHGLWVHPKWRRKGIALQLKTKLEEWALGIGCTMITTEAHLDNGLGIKELNEKMGYKVVRYLMQKRIP